MKIMNGVSVTLVALWIGLLLGAVGCSSTPSKIEAATPGTLFANVDSKTSVQLQSDPTILRGRAVQINFDALSGTTATATESARPAQTVRLNLFDDAVFVATLDRVDGKFPDTFVWTGHIDTVPKSQVTLSVNGKVMQGSITLVDKFYQVGFAGNGLHAVYQVNQAAFPHD